MNAKEGEVVKPGIQNFCHKKSGIKWQKTDLHVSIVAGFRSSAKFSRLRGSLRIGAIIDVCKHATAMVFKRVNFELC